MKGAACRGLQIGIRLFFDFFFLNIILCFKTFPFYIATRITFINVWLKVDRPSDGKIRLQYFYHVRLFRCSLCGKSKGMKEGMREKKKEKKSGEENQFWSHGNLTNGLLSNGICFCSIFIRIDRNIEAPKFVRYLSEFAVISLSNRSKAFFLSFLLHNMPVFVYISTLDAYFCV